MFLSICIISSLKGFEETGITLTLGRGTRKPKTNVEKEIIFYLIIVKFLNTYVQNTNRKNVRHKVILKHFLKVLNNGSTTV